MKWSAQTCLILALIGCGDSGDSKGSEARLGDGMEEPLPCEQPSYDECEDDQLEEGEPTSTKELAPVKDKLLPAEVPSGSCSLGAGGTAAWDAVARKLTLDGMWWVLNEQGLVVSTGQIADPVWRHELTYDPHQTPASFNYYWQDKVVPANSWTQDNTYDEEGRLTRSVRTYLDIAGRVSTVDYEYTDGELTSETQVHVPDAQTSPAGAKVTHYVREDGLVREVTREALGVIYNRTYASYDDRGRLVRLDSDGNGLAPTPDGTTDIRREWTYDDLGNCTGFTQDGTEILDAPFVDGVPDETRTFDPSCASIALLPEELYRYPAWYAPR